MDEKKIICIGEILWDSMPAGLFLGGAPFNVAHSLHRLGKSAEIASRVGGDFLGDEIVSRLRRKGMSTELIQVDQKLPTGFVQVLFDEIGNPDYRIPGPVAWDYIANERKLVETASESAMLVFGTLASRSETNRRTIHGLIEASPFKVLDVNLRPGMLSREIVADLLKAADLVKVNSSELDTLRRWFGLPANDKDAVEEIAKRFSNKMVCVSSGERGGSLWRDGDWISHPGFKVQVVNSVGAGDAFLAGLLTALTNGKSIGEMIETANLLGAYVVTRAEASPDFTQKDIEQIRQNLRHN